MSLLDLIFPKSCLECHKSGSPREAGRYFCPECLAKVQVLNYFDPISQTFSIFRYEGVIRKGIIKIKYNFAYDVASELTDICAQNLKLPYTIYGIQNTILVPIPLHKSRERWRGFNQSEILGCFLAKTLGWGFEKDLLRRPIQGQNQVGLSKSDRVRNIRGKFAVLPRRSVAKAGVTYIIFDDVATTGSTLKEAIKVLKNAGAKKVFALTIAR